MSKAKILVVDDEADVVRSLGIRLRSAGYEVLTAADGWMATQIAADKQPDLIVLDIGMPCGDGHTVAKRLALINKTATIPIVYLTARTGNADVEQALQAGAAGYLTKPFKPDALLNIIGRVLGGNAPATAKPAVTVP
jgi:two-component system, OmpR family, KDP operon response regulator KdpE